MSVKNPRLFTFRILPGSNMLTESTEDKEMLNGILVNELRNVYNIKYHAVKARKPNNVKVTQLFSLNCGTRS